MDPQVKQERLQGRLGPEIKEFRQERPHASASHC